MCLVENTQLCAEKENKNPWDDFHFRAVECVPYPSLCFALMDLLGSENVVRLFFLCEHPNYITTYISFHVWSRHLINWTIVRFRQH